MQWSNIIVLLDANSTRARITIWVNNPTQPNTRVISSTKIHKYAKNTKWTLPLNAVTNSHSFLCYFSECIFVFTLISDSNVLAPLLYDYNKNNIFQVVHDVIAIILIWSKICLERSIYSPRIIINPLQLDDIVPLLVEHNEYFFFLKSYFNLSTLTYFIANTTNTFDAILSLLVGKLDIDRCV